MNIKKIIQNIKNKSMYMGLIIHELKSSTKDANNYIIKINKDLTKYNELLNDLKNSDDIEYKLEITAKSINSKNWIQFYENLLIENKELLKKCNWINTMKYHLDTLSDNEIIHLNYDIEELCSDYVPYYSEEDWG